MTVATLQSQSIFLGTGSQTTFSFSFNNGVPFNSNASLANYAVTFTNSSGVRTILPSTTYSLTFNAAATGSLWGLGGNLIYPLVGSPIASGTSLTLQRIFPLQQLTSISNQGDFSPQNIEAMGDIEEMQLQQLSARTTQFRGIWLTGVNYSLGDIVQDGPNGANTLNYYICVNANLSGVWLTDLTTNGDWAISALAAVPSGNLTLIGDITGSGASPVTTILASVNSNVGNFTNANITVNAKGQVTAAANGSGGGGSGTVTSVTYTGDGVLQSSTPSAAVTGSGTVAAALIAQVKNTVLAGPASGSNAHPAFRALVNADFPTSGVSAGSYTNVSATVNVQGVVTAMSSGTVPLMTALAVGSIILAEYGTGSIISAGSTAAAGNLTSVGVNTTGGFNTTTDSLSGTWLALQTNPGSNGLATLWQRIV